MSPDDRDQLVARMRDRSAHVKTLRKMIRFKMRSHVLRPKILLHCLTFALVAVYLQELISNREVRHANQSILNYLSSSYYEESLVTNSFHYGQETTIVKHKFDKLGDKHQIQNWIKYWLLKNLLAESIPLYSMTAGTPKQAKDKMLNFLFKLKGVQMKKIVRAWKTVTSRSIIEPALAAANNMDEQIVEHEKEIKLREEKVDFLKQKREIQIGIIKSLNQDVLDLENKLKDPSRSPSTLQTIIAGLSKPVHAVLRIANRSVLRWASELTRTGMSAHRMGPGLVGENTPYMLQSNEWVIRGEDQSEKEREVETQIGVQSVISSEKSKRPSLSSISSGKKRLKRSRKERKGEADAAAKAELLSKLLPEYRHSPSVWTSEEELEANRPHADEDTLYPFDTRIGSTALRWLDMVVTSRAKGLQINTDLFHMPKTKHSSINDLVGGLSYAFVLDAINPEKSNLKSLLALELEAWDRCQIIYDQVSPAVRILSVDEMAGYPDEDDEKSEEKRRPQTPGTPGTPGTPSKRRRSSSGRNRKEMITRQVTYINGVKVEMEDDSEQRHFAWMAYVIFLHRCFPSGPADEVDASWLQVDESDDDHLATDTEINPDLSGSEASIDRERPAEGSARISWNNYVKKADLAMTLVKAESTKFEGSSLTELGIARSLDTLRGPCKDLSECVDILVASRDLFCRFRSALYEREQLRDFETRSQMLSFLGCYQAVLGRDTAIEEDVDDGTFTGRHIRDQVGDLMRAETSPSTGQKGLSEAEQEQYISELREFLVTHFRDSQMIFSHYAADSHTGGKSTMDRSEFWKLVKDLKLHRHLSGAEIDLIFQRSNLDVSIDRSQNKNYNPDGELEAHEFIEALIRLSACKYKSSRNISWVGKFKKMYIENLIPCAKKTNAAGFRDTALVDKQVKQVFLRERTKLRKIFSHFAAADTSNATVGNVTSSTINVKELLQMCRTLGIMRAGVLTDTTVRKLFAHVQVEEDAESGAAAGDDDEMNYDEFKEVILALSFMLFPDPWIPPFKKLQHFLEEAFAASPFL